MIKDSLVQIIRIAVLFSLTFFLVTCTNGPSNKTKGNPGFDDNGMLAVIRLRGKLIATTSYNSTDYFIYRGDPMGYQYDLLRSFAAYLGVDLEIVIHNDLDKAFASLNKGDCDLIARNIIITKDRAGFVDFSEPLSQTRQVLVQRKPDNWRKMKTWDDVESHLIHNPIYLGGKTIYIPKNGSFRMRLQNLSNEIGDSINIVEINDKTQEQLIAMVANGDIDYTICEEDVALVNQDYFPDIDVGTPVGFPQNTAWAVRKGSQELVNEINAWLASYKKSSEWKLTYNKYFKNPRLGRSALDEYHIIKHGRISGYDDFLKSQSKLLGWDWRLLASIIFQESGFNSNITSWAGAFGMMQLMPATARKFGVDAQSPPQANIEAGVKFLKWLDSQFEDIVKDKNERQKFVLASYNVGIAHVYDAMRLAEKYNKNPFVWTNSVDSFMLDKSDPKYYNDSVVYYGYARGSETFNFVNKVFENYNYFKKLIN